MYATKLLLELVMIIMEFADYKPRRTLEVPHDPLHPTNRKALDQYLEHCWQSILWCDMMMKFVMSCYAIHGFVLFSDGYASTSV